MRGGERERSRRAEMIDQRHAERAAFFGIGGGSDLVEQHERIRRDIERHLAQTRNMRREGAEVLLDRLVIADIGQHLFEDRKLGRGAGNGQPGLRHQRDHADRSSA